MIALTTKIIEIAFSAGVLISSRIDCPSPFCPITPNLAVISCRIMVARIENSSAQSKLNPKFAPALVATVTVPGPINAAATSAAGPMENFDFAIVVVVLWWFSKSLAIK